MTIKQREIYDIIKQFINKNGYSPSIRELCELSGRKSPATIHAHLCYLEEEGYIKTQNGKSRTIRITNKKIDDQLEGQLDIFDY